MAPEVFKVVCNLLSSDQQRPGCHRDWISEPEGGHRGLLSHDWSITKPERSRKPRSTSLGNHLVYCYAQISFLRRQVGKKHELTVQCFVTRSYLGISVRILSINTKFEDMGSNREGLHEPNTKLMGFQTNTKLPLSQVWTQPYPKTIYRLTDKASSSPSSKPDPETPHHMIEN